MEGLVKTHGKVERRRIGAILFRTDEPTLMETPMGWSFSIGRVAGIPIRVHVTFLLLLAWLFASFWHLGGVAVAANGLAYILLLFLCVVLHEFGHILMARRFGGETVDVVLLPIGGIARMKSIPEKAGQELAVALAGPLVNLIIATTLVSLLGMETMTRELARPGQSIAVLPQLAAANLFLALFNLIPAFPMDGGRALRALLSYRLGRLRATAVATQFGHVLAICFGVAGFLVGNPLLILVAAFVYFGASAENHDAQIHEMARHHFVADAMITQFSVLPVGSRIADAVAMLIHSTQHDVPVTDGIGKVIGLLCRKDILRAVHEHGGDSPIEVVMRSAVPLVDSNTELDEALRLMSERNFPVAVATDAAGRPVGMLTLENMGQLMLLERLGHGR